MHLSSASPQPVNITVNLVNRPPYQHANVPPRSPYPTSINVSFPTNLLPWVDADGPKTMVFTLQSLPTNGSLWLRNVTLGVGDTWNSSDIASALRILDLPIGDVDIIPFGFNFRYASNRVGAR